MKIPVLMMKALMRNPQKLCSRSRRLLILFFDFPASLCILYFGISNPFSIILSQPVKAAAESSSSEEDSSEEESEDEKPPAKPLKKVPKPAYDFLSYLLEFALVKCA